MADGNGFESSAQTLERLAYPAEKAPVEPGKTIARIRGIGLT
jgi:hypothetical protein